MKTKYKMNNRSGAVDTLEHIDGVFVCTDNQSGHGEDTARAVNQHDSLQAKSNLCDELVGEIKAIKRCVDIDCTIEKGSHLSNRIDAVIAKAKEIK